VPGRGGSLGYRAGLNVFTEVIHPKLRTCQLLEAVFGTQEGKALLIFVDLEKLTDHILAVKGFVVMMPERRHGT
jgi:hypothetical protein